MNHGCFVAWPLDPDAVTDVRSAVREGLADSGGDDIGSLLPGVGAVTVSVFLHRPDGAPPRLAWYVEHGDGAAWSNPAAAIRDHSPLFPRIESHIVDDTPTVVADAAADATELVHAALPDRPRAYAHRPEAPDAARPDGDRDVPTGDERHPEPPEVVSLVLRVRRGVGTLLARLLAGLIERTPDPLEAKLEAASLDVMEEEGMYTETMFLERGADGYAVWWYMESGGMEQVKDAYYDSDSPIARISEHVLGWILERPERAIVNPVEASEFELLGHAVDPARD